MKFIKKSLKIVVLVLVVIVIGGWLYSKTYHPNYSGEIEIKNLSEEVTIYFDEIGVPHINAQNQKDAYTALGYVHAQDRLWQMELIRRIAPGRLSEIFGKDLLKTDVFFSGLGIQEAAEKTIQNLDKTSECYQLTQAYLDGINQYIEERKTPLDIGFRVYKTASTILKDVAKHPNEVTQAEMFKDQDNIKEEATSEDILTAVLLDFGLTLDNPIETKNIAGSEVYIVDTNALVACFSKNIDMQVVEEIAKMQPLRAVFRAACFKDDKDLINTVESRFKQLAPNTKVHVI